MQIDTELGQLVLSPIRANLTNPPWISTAYLMLESASCWNAVFSVCFFTLRGSKIRGHGKGFHRQASVVIILIMSGILFLIIFHLARSTANKLKTTGHLYFPCYMIQKGIKKYYDINTVTSVTLSNIPIF